MTTPKKGGRPRLPVAAKLTKQTIYLNADQRRELSTLARDLGLSGPAVVRRGLALLAAAREALA